MRRAMTNLGIRKLVGGLCLASFVLSSGCANHFLKSKKQLKNEEFDKSVKITVPGDESTEPATPATGPDAAAAHLGHPPAEPEKAKVTKGKKKNSKKKGAAQVVTSAAKLSTAPVAPGLKPHEPADIEDGTLFDGRRPKNDPFWVGETIVHSVAYRVAGIYVSAGELTLKVGPYGEVNGRKAYNFITQVQSYPTFSHIYRADDKVVTLLDFDDLVPRVFSLHVKESGQLREARSLFDFEKGKATYWEKKFTEKNGEEEKKQQWDILPFSQNVFSAAFYMRLFPWETGKEYAFRVADDEQNLVFHGTAIRREVLDTDLGPMKAIVIKPQITVKGVFKPTGEILIWLSDDDRKQLLRLESTLKIGSLVSEIIRLDPGKKP